MTLMEEAIYRYSLRYMTDDERQMALALAAQGDQGNAAAKLALRKLALDVVYDANNREKRKGAEWT